MCRKNQFLEDIKVIDTELSKTGKNTFFKAAQQS